MKKYLISLAKTLGLGFGVGMVLAGAVGILYRAVHGGEADFQAGRVPLYLMVVGGVMGLFIGWCAALKGMLEGLLSTLFLRIAEKVPTPAAKVGSDWGGKMDGIFRQVLEPLPGLLKKIFHLFLTVRFSQYERINEAVEKAKGKAPGVTYTPQWYSQVILGYFLWPVKVLFYMTYAILSLIGLILWSLPFFG